MLQPQRFNFNAVVLCGKWQQQFKCVPVCFDGMRAQSPDVGQVLSKEHADACGQFHSRLSCQRVKSTKCFRIKASATLKYTLV
jgi:hypothetical protein